MNSNAALRYGQPRSFTRKYDKLLPNLGVSYDFSDAISAYVSYAETLSAPRTDDLYDQVLVDPGPERSKAYDVGLRYSKGPLLFAASIWLNQFSNRIERVLDEPSGVAFSQNVGDVDLKGIDGQVGFKPTDTLSFYGSLSYIDTEIKQDIRNAVAGVLATKGKSLYEIPKFQGGVRVQWEPIENFSIAAQGKFVGSRWSNLVNTERFRGYSLWDLDARYKLDGFGLKNTYIQGNIRNLFDKRYLGDISTNLTGTAVGQPGYRRTFIATLHIEY